MKLLLTSDLHSHTPWYHWLIEQAEHVDCIAIGGDMVEGLAPGNHIHKFSMAEWCLEKVIEQGCHAAVCSGNHEIYLKKNIRNQENPTTTLSLRTSLLDSGILNIKANPLLIGDAQTRLVDRGSESLIVTTIPYSKGDVARPSKIRLWEEEQKLRECQGYAWLVLHHEPPNGTRVGGHMGNLEIRSDIELYQPDYVLSGHLHQQPYECGGSYSDQIGKSICLNAGQMGNQSGRIPNHIILDSKTGNSHWVYC
jgi:Icc-related predicted phosphoesterase